LLDEGDWARIYGHEAVTPFALFLRGRFPFYLGAEFITDKIRNEEIYPITSLEIPDPNLPDCRFDLIVSSDVLEHVRDLNAALREAFRLLRPGGMLLATFPIWSAYDTELCAIVEEHTIRHLKEAEYHGTALDPERGALVFQYPGWDMINRCCQAGFCDGRFVFISSMRRGITAKPYGGVFVFEAVR
jgi:SAM-dependent methyltransferase